MVPFVNICKPKWHRVSRCGMKLEEILTFILVGLGILAQHFLAPFHEWSRHFWKQLVLESTGFRKLRRRNVATAETGAQGFLKTIYSPVLRNPLEKENNRPPKCLSTSRDIKSSRGQNGATFTKDEPPTNIPNNEARGYAKTRTKPQEIIVFDVFFHKLYQEKTSGAGSASAEGYFDT